MVELSTKERDLVREIARATVEYVTELLEAAYVMQTPFTPRGLREQRHVIACEILEAHLGMLREFGDDDAERARFDANHKELHP